MADTDRANSFPEAEVPVDEAPNARVISDTALPAAPPLPRRASVVPMMLGGGLAAALGFGAAQFVPDGWPVQSTAALEATLATQAAALTEAEAEIARLSAALAAVEARPAADPALSERLNAVEARPPYDDTAITARLTALEGQLAAIAALPADGSAASPAALAAQAEAIAALQAEVATLKGSTGNAADITAAAEAAAAQLAEAEARAAELRATAEAEAAQSLARASLRQLAVALETGGPFETALAGITAEIPEILSTNAATGLPTLTDLQTTFPDAARTALDTALRANMGDGWGARLTSFLRSQTGARSTTPREGDDPDAVLSRAEAALATGTVTDALALIAALPAESQTVMQPWVATANTYLAGQDALATLTSAFGVQE
jgi:hypothetical protein